MSSAIKSVSRIGALGVGLIGLAGQAHAQTPCGGPAGPDVIVGAINGVANYTATNGIEAVSFGTTSCNLGRVWLNWFSGTNQHPVIGGSLYRMKTAGGYTTFEQVGQSWLKHGFFALSQNLCCTCTATDGTHLGVGCSDPYTADRNGSQGSLGPKWQVNAHTGSFTYPPANPSFSGTAARRCEVLVTDCEVANASTPNIAYFGQGHYVTPDDATAGNQNNNASYTRLFVAGSGSAWTFSLNGTTQREKPAIRAWKAADQTVTESDVQIANDGLFILSSKATSLGGGNWHYEYALFNLNSDRSGRSFSVPLPQGATALNVGFHDVAYRNGDGIGNVNFSDSDWGVTISAGAITWTTQSFGENPSANALRWGTLYNFRFDTNVAPAATGNATFDLFKPGAAGDPTAGSGAAQVPGELPPPPACACDFNRDAVLSTQDFFDYLASFLVAQPSADYNVDGVVDSRDFFDYLGCFFAPPGGC